MEKENLTPAKFADKLQINRAIISHILNGRNNPSLDVVTKILSEMDYINTEWLINGTGNMYKDGVRDAPPSSAPDLFNQGPLISGTAPEPIEKTKETGFNQPDNVNQFVENKNIVASKNSDRKITQIIIYYDDSTFEVFGHSMK